MTPILADPAIFAAVFAVILLGGTIKGAIGIGLPAFSMSILPLFIEPALAVTILTLPIIMTNALQVLTTPGWPKIARQFAVAGVSIIITISIVSLFLADIPSRIIGIVVGFSLIFFAISSLMNLRLPVTTAPKWQILAGVLGGITGGLSAVKAPIMIYCAALDLPRDTFVAAAGFLFLMGGLGMFIGLSSSKLLNASTLPASGIAVVVAIVGFQIGALLRKRINAVLFRRLLLGAMLILGVRQILVNLF